MTSTVSELVWPTWGNDGFEKVKLTSVANEVNFINQRG